MHTLHTLTYYLTDNQTVCLVYAVLFLVYANRQDFPNAINRHSYADFVPPPGTIAPTPWDELSHPLGQMLRPLGQMLRLSQKPDK